MMELVLKQNELEFNSECLPQTSGTTIGAKMALACANIVMSILECNLLTGYVTSHLYGFVILMIFFPSGNMVKTN